MNISFDSKWKIGVIPSFSLTNKYKNKGFDEIASLIIEDSTSILIEELSKGNIDLLIGDVSKLNNRDLYRKDYIVKILWLFIMMTINLLRVQKLR